MKTIQLVLRLAETFLQERGVRRPRFVSELLLAHCLDVERIGLYMQWQRPLVEEELESFRALLKRASKHEPVDYLLGYVEFFGSTIQVGPGALIPRQETELLLERVCRGLDGCEKSVLDLCTGCGCIAAALKNRYPHLEVTGVDCSEEALQIARKNHPDVHWTLGDLVSPVLGQRFDLVVCNPPYVAEKEYSRLEPSVRNYEPKLALVAGPEGTEMYERLEAELPAILNPGAKIFFEIGAGQGELVQEIFFTERWEKRRMERDLAGYERFFSALFTFKESSSIIGPSPYV